MKFFWRFCLTIFLLYLDFRLLDAAFWFNNQASDLFVLLGIATFLATVLGSYLILHLLWKGWKLVEE